MIDTSACRDLTIDERATELRDARGRESVEVTAKVRTIFAHRWARSFSGSVASVGGALLLLVTTAVWLRDHAFLTFPFRAGEAELYFNLYRVFLGTLGCSVVAYGLGWVIGLQRLKLALRLPTLAGDPRETLVRLEAFVPREILAGKLARGEMASAMLPLVAQSLLGALMVHFAAIVLLTCSCYGYAYAGLMGFGEVIAFDDVNLGLANVALVLASARIALRLRRTKTDELASGSLREVRIALVVLVVALVGCSFVVHRSFGEPGIDVWFMQAVMVYPVAMGTFWFVPWMIRSTLRRVATERAQISLALAVSEPPNADSRAKG